MNSSDCSQLLLDTLSYTNPDQFRERLDTLKHKHRRAEQQLQQLVQQHQPQLVSAMQIYDNVSQRIVATRQRIGRVRSTLLQCKQLLHCRRHELKQLWLTGLEQRCTLQLLEQVEQLRRLPQLVAALMRDDRLYEASRQLADGRASFRKHQLGRLRALHDTQLELDTLAARLHTQLTDRLHGHLFGRCVNGAGAGVAVGAGAGSSARSSMRRAATTAIAAAVGGDTLELSVASATSVDLCQLRERLSADQLTALEAAGVGGGGGGAGSLLLVLESLVLLGRLTDTLETLYSRTNGELALLSARVTRQLLSECDGAQPQQLQLLVDRLGEQLLSVGDTLERVLALLRRVLPRAESTAASAAVASGGCNTGEDDVSTHTLYSGQHMWQRVQETLQRLFSEYLDSAGPGAGSGAGAAGSGITSPIVSTMGALTVATAQGGHAIIDAGSAGAVNLSSYFVRKRAGRPPVTQRHLFTFENSSTSLDLFGYLQEKSQQEGRTLPAEMAFASGGGDGGEGGTRVSLAKRLSLGVTRTRLPVRPHPFNIRWLYRPFVRLINQIEQRCQTAPPDDATVTAALTAPVAAAATAPAAAAAAKPCWLRVYVTDYIDDILLHRLRIEGQQLVERRIDNWYQVTDAKWWLSERQPPPAPITTTTVAATASAAVTVTLSADDCARERAEPGESELAAGGGWDSERPRTALLHSVWQVDQFVETLHQLMCVLDRHVNHLLSVVCAVLVQFKEAANAHLLFMCRATGGAVTGDDDTVVTGSGGGGEDGGGMVLSAVWSRDSDISRFLREQPGWLRHKQQQQQQHSYRTSGAAGDDLWRTTSVDLAVPVAATDEASQRDRREVELLSASMTDWHVQPADMLTDERVWRHLANFYHSLQWLAGRVRRRADELRHGGGWAGATAAVVPESSCQTLAQLGRDLDELADTALLTLYLEVRVLCFYHLRCLTEATHDSDARGADVCGAGAAGVEASAGGRRFDDDDDTDQADGNVARLVARLQTAGAALRAALPAATCSHLLAGAAPLAAHVLITGLARVQCVNENGVRRLVRSVEALQAALKQLAGRCDVGVLERARVYFELLQLQPDQLLQQLAAGGCVFDERQYTVLLRLMHHSGSGADEAALNADLERLAEIVAGHFAEHQ